MEGLLQLSVPNSQLDPVLMPFAANRQVGKIGGWQGWGLDWVKTLTFAAPQQALQSKENVAVPKEIDMSLQPTARSGASYTEAAAIYH